MTCTAYTLPEKAPRVQTESDKGRWYTVKESL